MELAIRADFVIHHQRIDISVIMQDVYKRQPTDIQQFGVPGVAEEVTQVEMCIRDRP